MQSNLNLKYALMISLIFFTFGCKKDKDNSPTPIDPNASYTGVFVSSAHETSGNVTVNSDSTQLNFTDFMTDTGPDLDIYLASDLSNVANNSIKISDIQGVDGNYTYVLPTNINFSTYKYVVIWCSDFSVNFGYANLVP